MVFVNDFRGYVLVSPAFVLMPSLQAPLHKWVTFMGCVAYRNVCYRENAVRGKWAHHFFADWLRREILNPLLLERLLDTGLVSTASDPTDSKVTLTIGSSLHVVIFTFELLNGAQLDMMTRQFSEVPIDVRG